MNSKIKKIIAVVLSFLMVFTTMGNSIVAYNSSYKKPANYGVNSYKLFVNLLQNKGLTKSGLAYLLKNRLTKQELITLKKGTRADKKRILTKFIRSGLSKQDLSYLSSHGGFTKVGASIAGISLSNPNLIVSAYLKQNNGKFLERFKNQAGVYKVNFVDITPSNANQIQAKFVGKANFPKKLVLPEGFVYEVKSNNLDKEFVKTNSLLTKVNQLKNSGIDVGNLQISQPVLQVLPDRLQYIKKVTISFKTQQQLNNIKTYLGKEFNFSNSNLELKNIKSKLIQGNIKVRNGYEPRNIIQDKSDMSGKNVTENQVKNAFNRLKSKGKIKSFNVFSQIDDNKIYNDLINECKKAGGNDSKCNKAYLQNQATKQLEIADKVEYSLIPTTLEDIRNGNIFIKYNPSKNASKFNLKKAAIYKRFVSLKEIQLAGVLAKQPFTIVGQQPKHDINAEDYCDILHSKDGKDAINECKKKQKEMMKITTANYENTLLNGFTLGESKNYSWGTSLSVSVPFVGSVKVFEIDFGLYYSYGFGIRIPIKVQGTISDNIVNDFKQDNARFTGSIHVSTFDGDENFYRNVGLAEEKIFRGKEFVFEVSAGANLHIRVKYLGGVDIEIPFIAMLATIFGNDILDSLGLETDADVQALGIPGVNSRAQILNYIIDHNGIDQSKDFVPPFAGENKIRLFKFTSPEIPFYNNGAVKLVGKIGVKSGLDGRVTVKCEGVNTQGGCPSGDPASSVGTSESSINIGADSSRIHIDTKNDYIGHGKAVFNADQKEEDELGYFSKFGLRFTDFRYHPILIFTIFARAGIGANIPLGVGWKTYWTPDIDIYTFKFSSDALYLGAHEGINEEHTYFEMIDNNKIYSTLSTLEDISLVQVRKIAGKYLPRSSIIIKPEENYRGANSTYYRLDGKIPYATVGTCGTYDENGTFEYGKPTPIWPNAKDELVNQKTFKIAVKSCDRLALGQIGAERTKISKPILVRNYYHKVFPTGSDDILVSNYDHNINFGLKLEELDNINLKVLGQCNPYMYLTGNLEKQAYYIKYTIVPIEEKQGTSGKGNNSNTIGTQGINYNTVINPEIADYIAKLPNCEGNGQLYKGEQFIFAAKGDNNSEQIAQRLHEDNPNSIIIDKPSMMYAVKCIGKSNPNQRGNVFKSLMTTIKLDVKKQLVCKKAQEHLADKASFDGSVKGVVDEVKNKIGAEGDMGGIGNSMLNQGGGKVMHGNYNFDGGKAGQQYDSRQTFGMNYNSNPGTIWNGQDKGFKKQGYSIPELQDKTPGARPGYGVRNNVNVPNLKSSNEYVNAKLKEINDCFVNTYNSHLKNLNDTIKRFENTRDRTSNQATKNKYQKAIDKLKEIKRLFILRYKNIIDYKNGVYNGENNAGNQVSETKTCPEGFVLVPGNPKYNTQDFCVTKYEVSYGPNQPYSPSNSAYFIHRYVKYIENKTPVSKSNSWALMTDYNNTVKTCQKMGGHVITENEKNTILDNLKQVDSNKYLNELYEGVNAGWSAGSNRENPKKDLQCYGIFAYSNGTGYPTYYYYVPTGSNYCKEKRELTLTNGQKIWDFSYGNVAEHYQGESDREKNFDKGVRCVK